MHSNGAPEGAGVQGAAGRHSSGRRSIRHAAHALTPAVLALLVVAWAHAAFARTPQAAPTPQPAPPPVAAVTFQQAIDRAIMNNSTVAVAAAGILRAEGLLKQARSAMLPLVTGGLVSTTLNTGVEFSGAVVTPRNQVTASITADAPIIAAAAWARRAQAEDNRQIAENSAAETRRQIALATADAYLSIIAARRVLDGDVRARDTAKAHFDLATELEQQGTGTRLNSLRAQQQLSAEETLVETAGLALYRAREALGVLIVSPTPVDAADEPTFDVPPDALALEARGVRSPEFIQARTDLRLLNSEQQAAVRVLKDSSKDRWPSLDAIFLPQSVHPAGFFAPANSWRFLLQASVPIFDSGQRSSLKIQRQAALDIATATLGGALNEAESQLRATREAVASGERGLASARAAADQAQQVVNIVNISFRAGAATNIEVIDAERSALDADTASAVAEDTLRRARLDLLMALGRFP
jgi:outer membrane protein